MITQLRKQKHISHGTVVRAYPKFGMHNQGSASSWDPFLLASVFLQSVWNYILVM